MFRCISCCEDKDLIEFAKCKTIKRGHKATCKKCVLEQKKKYKLRNREKVLEDSRIYARKRYAENREREIERNIKWKENNPEKYKESQKKSRAKHFQENKEKIYEYRKDYIDKNREKVQKYRRLYKKNNKEKVLKRHYEYWERYPEKYKATRAVNNAIAQGKMKRAEKCSRCDSTENIEGHHPDYSKPLEVIWLCRKCHNKEHGK